MLALDCERCQLTLSPVRLTRIILTALVVAACAPSVRQSGYAPKWHVGDWWVVKQWYRTGTAVSLEHQWAWAHLRYDVAGISKVNHRSCYVLEVRVQEIANSGIKDVFYVRMDNWLVVRQVSLRRYGDQLLPPDTSNYPLGLFGPYWGFEPRLPRFPLRLDNPDTLFRMQRRDETADDLREVSSIADSALYNRLINEGDTAAGRPVHPTGAVYEVRSEMAENLVPRPQLGDSTYERVEQSLQFWSEDQPWRLYEEMVSFYEPSHERSVEERNWLIASGHAGK